HVHEHYELIKTLSRRGIMNSICSKNDFKRIKEILETQGIWEYFIFPSIDWQPKGPRVAEIVNASQLRAPTILFIDDHPGNRREVEAAVPGIQTADETFIVTMLNDKCFQGKDDTQLTRLAQYKVLEKKQADIISSKGNNLTFLRNSNIRVYIDYDVERRIERAVELINRTNQLNYTKLRLSDDVS